MLTQDGLTLYFGSDRGTTYPEIRRVARAQASDPFDLASASTEQAIPPSGTSYPTWLSADECRIYLWHTDTNGVVILTATRSP